MSLIPGILSKMWKAAGGGAPTIQDQMLVMCHMDGVQGARTFVDECGHATATYDHCMLNNNPTKFGPTALYFDGAGDYAYIDNAYFDFLGADFTIELWFYMWGSGDNRQILGQHSTDSNRAYDCSFLFQSHQQKLSFSLYHPDGTATSITDPNVHALQTFIHLSVCRKGGVVTMYVNGQSVASMTVTKPFVGSGLPVLMGALWGINAPDTSNRWLSGTIDDLVILRGVALRDSPFTTPLTAFDNPSANPRPWAGGDGALGSVKLLVSGRNSAFTDYRGNPVINSGGVAFDTVNKKFGPGSAKFNGTNWLSYNVPFRLTGSMGFSVEAWICPNSLLTGYAGNSVYGAVIVCCDTDTPNRSWNMGLFGTAVAITKLAFFGDASGTAAAGQYKTVEGLFNFQLNTWYHIAAVRLGNQVRLYVDGAQISVEDTNNFSINLFKTTQPIKVGALNYVNYEYRFKGNIEDVRISSQSRSGGATYPVPTKEFFPEPATPPVVYTTDNFFDYVQLNIPMNDPAFSDVMGKTVLPGGGGVGFAATGSPFNLGVAAFSGTNGYLEIPYDAQANLGGYDFTIELWVNCTMTIGDYALLSGCWGVGAPDRGWALYFQAQGNLQFAITTDGATQINAVMATHGVLNGVWAHIAVCRNGPSIQAFVNGAQIGATYNIGTNSIYTVKKSTFIGYLQPHALYPFKGQLSNYRTTNGIGRYSAPFSPPAEPFGNTAPVDPLFDDVILHARLDFWAYTPSNTPFVVAGANMFPTTGKKVGGGSLLIDTTSEYVTYNTTNEPRFDLALGDFTIEFWANLTDNSVDRYALTKFVTWPSNLDFCMRVSGSTKKMQVLAGDNATISISSDNAFPTNAWTHVAAVREAGVTSMFINGVKQAATSSVAAQIPNDSKTLIVGAYATDGTSDRWQGYLSSLRITKTARYSSNFTPSDQPLPYGVRVAAARPALSNIALAMHMNGANDGTVFTEERRGLAITRVGAPVTKTDNKKFGSASALFNGTNQGLNTPDNAVFSLGTNFTLEAWIYLNALPPVSSGAPIFGQSNTGTFSEMYFGVDEGGWTMFNFYSGSWTTMYGRQIQLKKWTHVALAVENGVGRLFMDGICVRPTTGIQWLDRTTILQIGYNQTSNPAYLNGYIDELLVSSGTPYFDKAFIPPTEELAVPPI